MTKYLLVILLSLSAIDLHSQTQSNTFEFGFQGGLNINSASGKAINKKFRGTIAGLSAGGHVKFRIDDHFGIKVLLSYDQNGYAYRGLTFESSTGGGLVKGDVITRLNYINLPVMVEYSFGDKLRVNMDAGLFAGVMLNSSSTTIYEKPLPPGQPAEIKSTKNDHTANFGIPLGIGIQYPITSKIKLDLDLRNYTGLAGVYKNGNANSSKTMTNCLALIAGISFNL